MLFQLSTLQVQAVLNHPHKEIKGSEHAASTIIYIR